MIDGDSKFKKIMDEVNKHNPCVESTVWTDSIDPELDCRTAVGEHFVFEGDVKWLYWLIDKVGPEMDSELLKICINAVDDPHKAARIYRTLANLDDDDDKLLMEKFAKKLPKVGQKNRQD